MVQSRPRVAIVGGGIGGLFAANALVAQGLEVSVYEQAPAIGEIGAGVFLTPNSVRQLQRVGLEPAVEKWGARVGAEFALFPPRRRADRAGAGDGLLRLERHLRHAPRRSRRHAGRSAAGGHGAYRPSLHRVRAGRPTTARVSFANGASVEADIVIAADGIHSELAAVRVSVLTADILGLRRLSRPGAASSACRTGRSTAGRCGSARDGISWSFPCARENCSTMSASCRPMRR